MFDDEFTMLVSSEVMDLIHKTDELTCSIEVFDIALPYRVHVLILDKLNVEAGRTIKGVSLTHRPSRLYAT
jgi:hypothetical protein